MFVNLDSILRIKTDGLSLKRKVYHFSAISHYYILIPLLPEENPIGSSLWSPYLATPKGVQTREKEFEEDSSSSGITRCSKENGKFTIEKLLNSRYLKQRRSYHTYTYARAYTWNPRFSKFECSATLRANFNYAYTTNTSSYAPVLIVNVLFVVPWVHCSGVEPSTLSIKKSNQHWTGWSLKCCKSTKTVRVSPIEL